MPPRTTRKSTNEPQIDPWLTPYNRRACSVQKLIGVVTPKEDATAEMEQPNQLQARHQTSVFHWREGWMARTIPRPRWREKSVLDIPLYRSGHSAQNLSIPRLIASSRRSPSSQSCGIGRPSLWANRESSRITVAEFFAGRIWIIANWQCSTASARQLPAVFSCR